MARRPTNPRELPDALRDAVDRTVQATLGSAERSRDRTQGAIDELVDTVDQLKRGAEAGIARSRRVVTGAIEERRPATQEDLSDLKAELRAIGRRLDAIEERLPAKRSAPASRSGSTAKRASSGGGSSKRGSAASGSSKRASSGGSAKRGTTGSGPAKRGSSGGASARGRSSGTS